MPNIQCDALQLYTVRDMTAKDFPGTMKKVAEIGYKRVELAGYGNLKDAKSARKALDDAGLQAVICPFLPEDRRKDARGYEQVAKVLQRAAEQFHGQGIILGYHNHNFEFQNL